MNRTSEICGIITKDKIFVPLESQKERRNTVRFESIQVNNGWNFPKFGKGHKPTYSRSLENAK